MPPPSLPLQIQIHTYHCLCTTHLLTTPYTLSSLPHRAPPSLDNATILPLPPLTSSSLASDDNNTNNTSDPDPDPDPTTTTTTTDEGKVLPSLLSSSMRLARKVVVVRREDGFEKRRVWRCGRCGVGVGYELVGGAGEEKDGDGGRVMYLLEGGLRETGEMMGGEG